MKKTLLTFVAAWLAFAASALEVETQQKKLPLGDAFAGGGSFPAAGVAMMPQKITAAGETASMNYTPANAPYTYTGFNDQKVGMKIAQAFQMTPDMVNKFAGNDVSGIFFYTGMNEKESAQKAVNTIKKATLFLAYDLQDFEPFYTQSVDLPADGLTLVNFKLDTPFRIEAGKPFYIGYYYPLTSPDDLTLIIDAEYHGDDVSGCWLGLQAPKTSADDNPEWQFDNFSDQIGFLCLGATISGDNLPQNELSVPAVQMQPTVYQNDEFSLLFMIENNASNDVKSFEVEVKVGDKDAESMVFNVPNPLGYSKSAVGSIDGLSYDVAALEDVPVTLTVTKVNGEPNNSVMASGTTGIQVIPTGLGYVRNVLVEEFTGTWCGYCPQGIVTMEKLRETYTDGSVIPVAVHNRDEMSSTTFSSVDQTYSTGYPSAIMNRQMYIKAIFPVADCIEEIEEYQSYPAPAKVTATAHFNAAKNGIIFDTKTAFSFGNDKASEDYVLSFAVTEDKVGPYEQNNNFSGSTTVPGWGNKPNKVETIYNDVARQYNSGIAGSVPESVEVGKEYDFTYEMKFLAASKISNKDNLNAIVYLINRKSNVVENAYMINSGALGGIDDIFEDSAVDADAQVEYFNLQGIRVTDPQNGVYIRRQGSDVQKVTVR